MWDFPLFPDNASTIAGDIDAVYFGLIALSILFGLGVAFMVTFLAIRYRKGTEVDRSNPSSGSMALELTWSIIPLILGLGIFARGADVYFNLYRIPGDAMEISAIGKQWMWKYQHPGGQREINDLHVPVGRPIKMNMISQDVIHSFFIPAFRIKRDVLPGTYTTVWFEATKTGEFHLFCAEYCGLDHAVMGGKVIVMEPAEYEQWLAGVKGSTAAITGEQLFQQQGCETCHRMDGSGAGPSLVGLFSKPELLQNGETVMVDEQYIRDSILLPNQEIVEGYQAIMPTYEQRLTEEDIMELINYIKSLAESDDANEGG
jgi:cytochrome c oxidase subunit 2